MKTNTFHAKKVLALLFAALLPLLASAEKVEIDGIWYNLTSETQQAEVTSKSSGKYSGSITLPATVTYEGVEYGVTSIGEAFRFCSSLTTIYIPASVTSIGAAAFQYCRSLTAINIPKGVTSIGACTFLDCSSLTAIYIPEGSQLTSIGDYAFSGCSSLTAITIPGGVTSIGHNAFEGCSSLTAINIPKGVTSIGSWAFYNCSSLTSITIPEGSQLTSIGEKAFYDCSSLTAITLPASVISIGKYAFSGCGGELTVNCNIPSASSSSDGVFYNSYFTKVTIGEGVTSIGSWAFGDCSSLAAITIPESVTSIGDCAFYDCSSLTAINIPESVTSIGWGAFSGCSSLTAINIPEGVTSIGDYAFRYCSSLTSINIPEGVTSIGRYAFSYCSSLTKVYCYAEHVPEAVSYSFSDVENATLYVPESAIGDYQNTAPWSSFGRIKALVANGEYYLYHADSHRCLSRGEYWGTCATVDKYGVPFVWTADEYSLQFLDSNVCLFETDDSSIYTDNATTGFDFEVVEGGYLLKSLKSDRYLTIVDHQIVSVADDASAAVVWQLKSKAEHDAIVAGYVEENYTNVIAAAGITATAGDFADYLATLEAEDKTSAIGTARFNGNAGEWIFTEVRHQDNQPAIGTDFCELWQATGSYTQTITNLPEGIYKVTMQGFERSSNWGVCNALGDRGYEITIATLCANGEQVNLKSWYSGKSGDNNPNSTDEAVAKFNEGKYMNEVYTYVGTDSTLTITVNKPSHVFDNWILFNNFTLTRYALAVEEITLSKETATLTEGDALTLVAVVSPDNAADKTVTWSTSDDKVATVDENGKIIAIAPGTAIITATSGDKSATCKVVVEAASYVFTLKVEDEEYFTQTVKRGTNLATLMAKYEVATPTKVGYTFSGWEVPETMPANNLTLNGTFTINKYLVTFKIGEEVIISDSLEYGAAIVAPEAPKKEGYTFSGWDAVPEVMPDHDVVIKGSFVPNKYLVTFKIDGVIISSESLEYGSSITVPNVPEREGYTFSGWNDVDATVPAGDVTYHATYTANTYNVYYFVGATLVHTAEVAYGETIPEYIYVSTTEGDVFMGWIGEAYDTMPAHDVTYTANISNGIDAMSTGQQSAVIYDLTGRKVTDDTENLTGGIYIIGGKKVIIK